MNDQPKISLPEIIMMILLSLLSEVLDIVDFGWVIGFPLQFWVFLRGGDFSFKKQGASIIGNVLEVIPILNWFPIRTITLIISIYMINHPEKSGVLGKVAGLVK